MSAHSAHDHPDRTSRTSRTSRTERKRRPPTLLRDRVLVSIAAVVWLAGTYVGSGLAGEGVSQQAQGLFSDHATLIAPHGPAFAIWSVIYLGLAAYVIWQWMPPSALSPWASRTRVLAAVAIALNGIWLFVVQAGLVWLSVIVMAGIVVSLGALLAGTAGLAPEGLATTLVVPVTFGLYLGWICVATCANIAAFLVGVGVPAATGFSVVATVAVLVVVVALAAFLVRRLGTRAAAVSLGTAMVWGLAWVAVGRFVGLLQSSVVAWAAVGAAVAVSVVALTAPRPVE